MDPLQFLLTSTRELTKEEWGVRSEVECAEEKSDVADDTPQTTRKRRASNENEPRVTLGTMDVNASKKKSGKWKASQKREEQPPTGTIMTEHDKSKEAFKVAVVFMYVLMVADTVTRMEQKWRMYMREWRRDWKSYLQMCSASANNWINTLLVVNKKGKDTQSISIKLWWFTVALTASSNDLNGCKLYTPSSVSWGTPAAITTSSSHSLLHTQAHWSCES